MMSSLALHAEDFVRCLCREQSTGSFSWFNNLINKTCNYVLFLQMNEMNGICEKMQYALGIAEGPVDDACLSNATVPVCDRQGPQELCKWQICNLIQALMLSKYDWEHLTRTTFLIRCRNKSLRENWQQHLNLICFHYRKLNTNSNQVELQNLYSCINGVDADAFPVVEQKPFHMP